MGLVVIINCFQLHVLDVAHVLVPGADEELEVLRQVHHHVRLEQLPLVWWPPLLLLRFLRRFFLSLSLASLRSSSARLTRSCLAFSTDQVLVFARLGLVLLLALQLALDALDAALQRVHHGHHLYAVALRSLVV